MGKWLSRWEKNQGNIMGIKWGIYVYNIYILYYIKLRNNNYITMSDLRYYMYTYIYMVGLETPLSQAVIPFVWLLDLKAVGCYRR